MTKNENEFLPFLNSWLLLFIAIAGLMYYSKIHFYDITVARLKARKATQPNSSKTKKAA